MGEAPQGGCGASLPKPDSGGTISLGSFGWPMGGIASAIYVREIMHVNA